MKKETFISQSHSIGGVLIRKDEPVMSENRKLSHLNVLQKQAFLQRTLSEQSMEGFIERDWSCFIL